MAKAKCPPPKKSSPAWMTTYGDMTTLLLTFFIAMLNLSEITEVQLNLILSAFRGGFGVYQGGTTLSKGILVDMGMNVQSLPSKQAGSKMDKALKMAQSILESEIKSKKVLVKEDERGIVISLVGDAYFEPGDATLLPETKELLDKVSKIIVDLKEYLGSDNKIEVEGFADSGQITTDRPYYTKYPTNLDLASARSNNVIKYFWASGVSPTRIYKGKIYAKFKSISYGEFQPSEANISPEARAYNRRVDIVIVREEE
jgi:chemotaxis protein MotB